MSNFSIAFYDVNKIEINDFKIPVCDGVIEIDDWKQEFTSRLDYWTLNDYMEFWKYSLNTILSGQEIACLITLMSSPEAFPGSIELWLMYRKKNDIYIQGKMICDPEIRKCFDPYNFSAYVGERRRFDKWGNKLWEKKTSVQAIQDFLERGRMDRVE